ncbi:hypothetical protein H5410_053246 [Solanum commersonii]|uniref:UDP-glucuronate decarboxylase n=1 Tax=Solanum commersonii TaxID=4109 RepID=A0A9J5X3B7_SOLCO|nr:hypothetical protein H5410_053246 [Solanum commersonii]
MKLHTQSSMNHRRDEETTMSISQNTPPSSPKTFKHPRSLPRSINYLLKEQRLLFILVGILIGSTFFILQPSLSLFTPSSPIPQSYHGFDSVPGVITHTSTVTTPYRGAGRVPVGIGRKRMRVVVTGGAGFVGSHLVDKLIKRGDDIIVIDNFFTGRKENVMHHFGDHRFELIRHDVVEPILLEVDQIYHLACPASPVHYKYNPVKTIISFVYISIWIVFLYSLCIKACFLFLCDGGVHGFTGISDCLRCIFMFSFYFDVLEILNSDYKTNVMGTLNMLGLAKRIGARFLLTSTSEVYGDPLEHPQKETYWGNVNPIGVRSCYDEGKRTAETLTMDYHRGADVEVRIARIFNTYGPRMCLDDGRVVSNFVAQAIRKQPMTVYGDGKQTRSFQYVSDLVRR